MIALLQQLCIMASVLIIFLHLALMWIYCNGGRVKMREVAYMYELKPCEGVATTGFLNSSFHFGGKDNYKVNITVDIEDAYNDLQGIFDTKVCTTRALSNCVDLLTFPVDDYCSVVANKGFWNLILNKFKPPLQCPLQGRYQLTNFSISEVVPEIKKFLRVGLVSDGTIYFTMLTLKTRNEIICCLKIVSTFILVKVKSPRQ